MIDWIELTKESLPPKGENVLIFADSQVVIAKLKNAGLDLLSTEKEVLIMHWDFGNVTRTNPKWVSHFALITNPNSPNS